MELPSFENRLRFKHFALLRYIQAEGSLHKAALRLHISQPAASNLLREIEALFGGALFNRSSTGLTATKAGTMLLEHVEAVLSEVALAQEEVVSSITDNPIVRIGASAIAVQLELLPVLGMFNNAYPKGQVRILEGRTVPLLEMLRNGHIDLAIGMVSAFAFRDEILRGISYQLLRQEEWVVIASRNHPLARKRKIALEDLKECRWVLQPQESLIRIAFEQAFHLQGLMPPRPCIEALPFSTNLAAVRTLDLVTIAPRSSIISHENAGSFIILKTALKPDVPPLAVFYKTGTLKRSPMRKLFNLLTLQP